MYVVSKFLFIRLTADVNHCLDIFLDQGAHDVVTWTLGGLGALLERGAQRVDPLRTTVDVEVPIFQGRALIMISCVHHNSLCC